MSTILTNPVGRPREFDESAVLDAAMEVFWRKGYEKTSMVELLVATGLHKGSLYQAFGDKRSLFILALRRYISNLKQEMSQVMTDAPSGIEGIREALYRNIDMGCTGDGSNSGCMALNTLVDKGKEDADVLAVLQDAFGNRMKMVTESVARAQAEGDIRADMPAQRIATIIITLVAGLAASLRGAVDTEQSRVVVDDVLLTLRPGT